MGGIVPDDSVRESGPIGRFRYALALVYVYLRTLAFVGLAPAWIAHEITHYVAARLVGFPAEFVRFPGPAVDVLVPPESERTRGDRARIALFKLAPTGLGIAVGVAWLLVAGPPPLDALGMIGTAYWVTFSYPSADDREFRGEITVGGGDGGSG